MNQQLHNRPEGIRPILLKMFNDRGQMDFIILQAQAYEGYTSIPHYQDHLTKFSHLHPLKSKTVSQHLCRIAKKDIIYAYVTFLHFAFTHVTIRLLLWYMS